MTKEMELSFSVWECKKFDKAQTAANWKLMENGSQLVITCIYADIFDKCSLW